MYFLIPIFIALIIGGAIGLTFAMNTFFIPYFGWDAAMMLDLKTSIFVVVGATILYFLIFSKKLESKKFKDYLNKN